MAPHQRRRTEFNYWVHAGRFVHTASDELVEGYVVQTRVAETDRGWVITDLCISLANPDWEDQLLRDGKDFPLFLTSWLPIPDDTAAPIPGIGSATLTKLKMSDLRASIRRSASGDIDRGPEDDWVEDLVASMEGGRSKRRSDHFFALVAAVYLQQLENPAGIYKAMSDHFSLSESTVVDYVKVARRRDLLTPAPGRGRKGGNLTDKARDLLARPRIRIVDREDA